MANWDSTKDEDSDLTAEQWNNHVSDQKTRAKHYIQDEEPTDATDSDLWSELVPDFEPKFEHTHHSDRVWSVHESNGVVYSASADETVVAADLDGIEFDSVTFNANDSVLKLSDGENWYEVE